MFDDYRTFSNTTNEPIYNNNKNVVNNKDILNTTYEVISNNKQVSNKANYYTFCNDIIHARYMLGIIANIISQSFITTTNKCLILAMNTFTNKTNDF